MCACRIQDSPSSPLVTFTIRNHRPRHLVAHNHRARGPRRHNPAAELATFGLGASHTAYGLGPSAKAGGPGRAAQARAEQT